MIQPPTLTKVPQSDYVSLSLCGFGFWWCIILGVYLATSLYNAAFAKFYWDFDSSFLSYSLESYDVGIARKNFRTVAYVHIGLAIVHGICAFQMLVGSLLQRSLSFSFSLCETKSRSGLAKEAQIMKNMNTTKTAKARQHLQVSPAFRVLRLLYEKIADRNGVFGVNGKYFHTILICRELLETALQTVQAVRMSKYLSRTLLNRFYVILIVINCWSSVFVYSRWFWRDEARRRFASIVCDCVLDLMSVMGVSIMIVLSYVKDYNVAMTGFGFELLGDDEWVAQMLNEAQLVIVVSWSDLATRAVFSLGIIFTTTSMAELIRYEPKNRNRIIDVAETNKHSKGPLVLDKLQRLFVCGSTTSEFSQGGSQLVDTNENLRAHKISGPAIRGVHLLFSVWGIAVILLHVHASMQTPLMECMPKVRPMAGTLPSCFVVNFNCHVLGMTATKEEVRTEWSRFEPNTVAKLQLLHCSGLEIPETLQQFSHLQEIRVYNSTIVNWTNESAVTNANNPKLTMVSLVRVNMTSGLLPLGLQSLDFPLGLIHLYFCETNLQTLPDDLDLKWHLWSNIYLENSNLTGIPLALMRLQPAYLTLAGNPTAELPPELFEVGYLEFLILGRSKVQALPEHVFQPSSGPMMIDITSTNISFFWSWIDALVENMLDISPPLIAGDSKYCTEREMIMNGEAAGFSTPFQAGHSALLMNASETNWDFLRLAVDCTPLEWTTQFPLSLWDKMYGLVDENDIQSID